MFALVTALLEIPLLEIILYSFAFGTDVVGFAISSD